MNAIKNNLSATLHLKVEKPGYTLWEDDIIIEAGVSMAVLVEMEKGE